MRVFPREINIDDLSEKDRNMVIAARANDCHYVGMVCEGGVFIDTIHVTRPEPAYQDPRMSYYRYDTLSQSLVKIISNLL